MSVDVVLVLDQLAFEDAHQQCALLAGLRETAG
jgi:hypothetical protein